MNLKIIAPILLAIGLVLVLIFGVTQQTPSPIPPLKKGKKSHPVKSPAKKSHPTLIVFVVNQKGKPLLADVLAMKMGKRMEEGVGKKGAPDRFVYRLTPHKSKIPGHWTSGL